MEHSFFAKNRIDFHLHILLKFAIRLLPTQRAIKQYDWNFYNRDFVETINEAKAGDLIYCDPPYLGRYVDYYNGWTESDEELLYNVLRNTPAHFILSTWHHNEYRENI